MKIAILSRSPFLYSTQSLVEAAERQHHEVTVLDQHYYDNVSCTFYSFQQNGTSGSFATDSSSGSSASPVTLDSFYTASMYTYTKGVMLVRCSVPDIYSGNESGIHTIWYIEN